MTVRTRDDIRSAIFEALGAIAPEADPGTLAPDQSLREQVDIDSFDFLNIIIKLHEKLAIDIPESDYGALRTLNSAVDYLARRCGIA